MQKLRLVESMEATERAHQAYRCHRSVGKLDDTDGRDATARLPERP